MILKKNIEMKKPLFNEIDRFYIRNYYKNEFLERNSLIEKYELAKTINNFHKTFKNSYVYKLTERFVDWLIKFKIFQNKKIS